MDILYTIMFMLYALVMFCCHIYLNRRIEMMEEFWLKMQRRLDALEKQLEYDISTCNEECYMPYNQDLCERKEDE